MRKAQIPQQTASLAIQANTVQRQPLQLLREYAVLATTALSNQQKSTKLYVQLEHTAWPDLQHLRNALQVLIKTPLVNQLARTALLATTARKVAALKYSALLELTVQARVHSLSNVARVLLT